MLQRRQILFFARVAPTSNSSSSQICCSMERQVVYGSIPSILSVVNRYIVNVSGKMCYRAICRCQDVTIKAKQNVRQCECPELSCVLELHKVV